MSEIDAAELARLRADATDFYQYSCLLMEKTQIIALLDAVEKARPAPSQGDEAAGEDAYAKTETRMSKALPDPFRPMRDFAAAVRAEATLAGAAAERERIEAAVRCAPCLDGDGRVIATSVAIDAIRARKP